MPSSDTLLACPRCGGELASLRCARCAVEYAAPDGIPDLRLPAEPRTERVRQFYAQAPFPGDAPRDSLSSLRARAARRGFARALDAAIPGGAPVREMGCGTGQLSLFLASADRVVIGADLTRSSLALAQPGGEGVGGRAGGCVR